MLVEFMGLPGSGKSTLITHTEKHLRKAGLDVYNIGKESRLEAERQAKEIQYLSRYSGRAWLYGCFAFAQEHPAVFDALFQNTRDKFHETLWAMDFLAQLYFLKLSDTKDGFVFIDEGFMQRGAAAFREVKSTPGLAGYLDSVPSSDVLVMVNLTPQLAFSRGRRRKGGLPDSIVGRSKSETILNLENFANLLDYFKENQRLAGVSILELDASADLSDCVEVVTRYLTEHQQTVAAAKKQ